MDSDVGLKPRITGSWPERKADTQPAEPPRCHNFSIILRVLLTVTGYKPVYKITVKGAWVAQ